MSRVLAEPLSRGACPPASIPIESFASTPLDYEPGSGQLSREKYLWLTPTEEISHSTLSPEVEDNPAISIFLVAY